MLPMAADRLAYITSVEVNVQAQAASAPLSNTCARWIWSVVSYESEGVRDGAMCGHRRSHVWAQSAALLSTV